MEKKLDLRNDSINKLFIGFALPAVIGMIASTTAGLVDSYFIGNYVGGEGIAGITLVAPIMNILLGIVGMITAGGSVLAGMAYGKKDFEESNNYFNVTINMVIIFSAFMMIFIALFGGTIINNLLGIEGNTAQYVLEYLGILKYFILPFMLVFTLNFFLKLDGLPTVVVVGTLLGVVINIVFDYLFVGVFRWGMKGAALATGLSQAIPCIIFLYIVIAKSRWKFKKPIYRKRDVKAIIYNGSSEFLSLASVGIAGYIYNLIIAKHMGNDGIAAYGIAMQISSIATMIYYGISDAIQSIVSFNFGAKQLDRVKKIRNLAFKSSFFIGLVILIGLLFFRVPLAGLFVKDAAIASLAGYILIFYGISLVLAGVNINGSTYYTALGQPKKSAILAISRSLIALIVGLFILPSVFGELGIWLPLIFTELVTIIIVGYYIKRYPFGDKV